jgi:hypothetical protein
VVAGFHTDFLPGMMTLIVFGKLYLGVYGKIILKCIFKCWMGHVDWFDLALERGWWRAIVNGVMNLRVP